jgi:hypothetical protein
MTWAVFPDRDGTLVKEVGYLSLGVVGTQGANSVQCLRDRVLCGPSPSSAFLRLDSRHLGKAQRTAKGHTAGSLSAAWLAALLKVDCFRPALGRPQC